MNGKKAKKLRRMAVQISEGIARDTGTHILAANPFKVYAELKKIDKEFRNKK